MTVLEPSGCSQAGTAERGAGGGGRHPDVRLPRVALRRARQLHRHPAGAEQAAGGSSSPPPAGVRNRVPHARGAGMQPVHAQC
jgi:hypothetical protein